jgi:hypothetical protein
MWPSLFNQLFRTQRPTSNKALLRLVLGKLATQDDEIAALKRRLDARDAQAVRRTQTQEKRG